MTQLAALVRGWGMSEVRGMVAVLLLLRVVAVAAGGVTAGSRQQQEEDLWIAKGLLKATSICSLHGEGLPLSL
jgi:hypothetical protein